MFRGGLMNIGLRLQQTHEMHFWAYVWFVESSHSSVSNCWVCFVVQGSLCDVDFLVSCYRLAEARPKVWRPPVSHFFAAPISRSAASDSFPGTLPPSGGRQGANPGVCHRDTTRSVGVRRRSDGLSAPLKAELQCHGPTSLCVWAQWRDVGGWIVPCVGCTVLLLHAGMTLTLTAWHLLSWYFVINACLSWTVLLHWQLLILFFKNPHGGSSFLLRLPRVLLSAAQMH